MSRFLSAFLATALALSIAACSEDNKADPNNPGGGNNSGGGNGGNGGGSGGEDAAAQPDAGTGADGGAGDGGTALPDCPAPKPGDESTLPPGKTADGRVLLPDGRAITPEGQTLKVGVWPTAMLLTPDGKYLIVTNSGNVRPNHHLEVVDTASMKSAHKEAFKALFTGLALDSKNNLYAAGGTSSKVYRVKLGPDGKLTRDAEWDVDKFPAGLALSPDEKSLYVARNDLTVVRKIDLATGASEDFAGGNYPYSLYVTADGKRMFVSSWGVKDAGRPRTPGTVSVVDLATGKAAADPIPVGKNPEMIVPAKDGKRLYVVSTDADRIDILDIESAKNTGNIPLDDDPKLSVFPNAVAESPDGKTLYVTSVAKNSIEVVDVASKKVLGSIPTAWYPIDVKLSADGKTLYWLAGKGEGSGPNPKSEYVGGMMAGVLGKTPVPDAAKLAELTKKVNSNNARRDFSAGCRPTGGVWPAGDRKSPIKHVVLVVKENRTYDQILGDLEGSNGDKSLTEFGELITPNTHNLARQFVNLDNFHAESEISIQGHIWLSAMVSNSYSEKTWGPNYRDDGRQPLTGVEQASFTEAGFFITHVLDNGLIFRSYGEITGPGNQVQRLQKYISTEYGFFSMERSDVEKVKIFLKDLQAGIFPEYVYILIPNDHTYGRNPGRPTPEWMVSDNDYALGMIVEGISNSPYWNETVIFVTEDDPQDGADHVDAHRTLGLVISPWTKKGHTSSVHYSFMSFFRTAEIFLGLPPMNVYDELAAPIFDGFMDASDGRTYKAVMPQGWDTPKKNQMGEPGSWESMEMDFSLPDQNPGLGDIIRMGRTNQHGVKVRWTKDPDGD
ncbi:MAG: hypothetical protein GMKNLPBB_01765 [Myxococcota bacterium]|nr:hypothetical protein [Myxococcota bacterium]